MLTLVAVHRQLATRKRETFRCEKQLCRTLRKQGKTFSAGQLERNCMDSRYAIQDMQAYVLILQCEMFCQKEGWFKTGGVQTKEQLIWMSFNCSIAYLAVLESGDPRLHFFGNENR